MVVRLFLTSKCCFLQNFDDVLVPADHVSRSYNDTYYVDSQTVLRCHTSAHQAELLRDGHTHFLVTGDVYRRDSIDSTHYPVFHQVTLFCYIHTYLSRILFLIIFSTCRWKASVSFLQMTGQVLAWMGQHMQLQTSRKRWKAWQDIFLVNYLHPVPCYWKIWSNRSTCQLNNIDKHVCRCCRDAMGWHLLSIHQPILWAWNIFSGITLGVQVFWGSSIGKTCRTTYVDMVGFWLTFSSYKDDWLEVLGCGVTEQEILKRNGRTDHVAWAFGLGLERLAMVLFDIPDIRLFWSNDKRFTSQVLLL